MILRGGVVLRSEHPIAPTDVMWHASVRVPGVCLPMFELYCAVLLRCLGDRVDCFQTALAIMSSLLVIPERFVFSDNSAGAPGGIVTALFATRHISVPKSVDPRRYTATRLLNIQKPGYALMIGQFSAAADPAASPITVYIKMVGQVMTNVTLTDSQDSFLPWFALCDHAPAHPTPVSLYDFVMQYLREQGWLQEHSSDEAADDLHFVQRAKL